MRASKFKSIEVLFADFLRTEAVRIKEDFDDVMCNVYVHYPPNDEPQYGYFCISLECILNKADLDKTDLVSLAIDIDDHNNKFKINASVSWGNPYARTIEMVFTEPVDATEKNLTIIKEKLPFLVSKFRELIRDNPNGI